MNSESALSSKGHTIRSVGWAGAERWASQFLNLVIFTVVARLLDPTSFGLVALAGVYTALLDIFVTQGFTTAIVQRREVETGHLDTAFWISVGSAIFIVIGTVLVAPIAAHFLQEPQLTLILRVLSLTFLISAMNVVPTALLVREMAFSRLAIRTLIGVISGGIAGIGCAWAGFGVWSLVAQYLTGAVAGCLALWRVTTWRPAFSFSWSHFADLRSFGLAIMGNSFLWFFSRKADEAIIGGGLGATALGSYSVANRLTSVVIELLNSPGQIVALPALSKMQDDISRVGRTFIKGTIVMCAMGFPVFIGLLILAPDALPIVFGPKWVDAVPVVQILCIAGMLRVWQGMIHPTMLALGKPWIYLLLFALHAGTTVVTTLVAIQTARIEIVALAQVLSNFVTGMANFVVLRRFAKYKISELLSGMLRIAAPCVVMAAGVLIIRNALVCQDLNRIINLAACVLSGGAIYLAAIRFTLAQEVMEVFIAVRTRHSAAVDSSV